MTVLGVLTPATNVGLKRRPESQDGSKCHNGRNNNHCESVLGDYQHIPYCDPNAQYKFKRDFLKDTKIFKCQCNKGFERNSVSQ